MPITPIEPPANAIQAFAQGVNWLGEVENRFVGLRLYEDPAQALPVVHQVEILGLNGYLHSRQYKQRAWRFFVSGPGISLGVIEVVGAISFLIRKESYRFFAFREGPPIEAALDAFGVANRVIMQDGNMATVLLKIPALSAMFFWLKRLEGPRPSWDRLRRDDWLLPIAPGARGFETLQLYSMQEASQMLAVELERVRNMPFVRNLHGGQEQREEEPPAFAV